MKESLLGAAMAAILLTSCSALQGTSSRTNSSSLLGNVATGMLSGAVNGGTASTGATASTTAGLLGSLLGNLLGASATLSDNTIVGTWTYTGSDVVFESENFLAQMGGEMASGALKTQINNGLQKVGIMPGACSFTFKADHTYTATIAGKSISGQWALDPANKQIQLTLLMGLGQVAPKIAYNGGTLSLLMESSKLLALAQGVGAMTNNKTVQSVSGLLGNYKGMYIGLQMQR